MEEAIQEALEELEKSRAWCVYRDSEKRAIAFREGAKWAATFLAAAAVQTANDVKPLPEG